MGRRGPDSDPVRLSIADRASLIVNRRSFMFTSLLAGMAGALADADRAALGIESVFSNTRTTILTAKGEVLRPGTESIVLDFSGQNYKVNNTIDVLTSLDPLGVRTKVELGNKGDPVSDVIHKLHSMRQLRRMSVVADSDSWPIPAQVIPAVSDQIDTEFVFLFSSPENIGDVKGLPRILAEVLVGTGYGPSPALTGLTDLFQFGNPIAPYTDPQAASAEEAYYQVNEEAHSDEITRDFAKFLAHYNATDGEQMRIAYLLLQDPTRDPLVNEVQSLRDFSRRLPIDIVRIGGLHQGHDNPTENPYAVNAALRYYLATHGF